MSSRTVVIARLVKGDNIRMQYRGGERQWWFEDPRMDVSDSVMQSIQAAGAVAEAGDSLFGLPFNSQTWIGVDFGEER